MNIVEITDQLATIDSKEEKLRVLMDHIWETLYEGVNSGTLDTAKLRLTTIYYIKCSFDAENEHTSFVENMPEDVNASYDKYNGVELNVFNFDIGTKALDDMYTYAKFLGSVSHELTHRNDEHSQSNNNIPFDSRFSHGYGYSSSLTQLGTLLNKAQYKQLGNALYYNSSNEFVARKVSNSFRESFTKHLRKMTNERLPEREQAAERTNNFFALVEKGASFSDAIKITNFNNEDYISKKMHESLDNIEDFSNMMNEITQDKPGKCYATISQYLPEAQEDFARQCTKYINGTCTKQELEVFDPCDMAILMAKWEFFDEKLGRKLYKKISNDNELHPRLSNLALYELSNVPELKIPSKEREMHAKNYEEYIYLANASQQKSSEINL